MHKDDLMSPVERLTAFLSGKPLDRVLTMPVCCSMSGTVSGMTHKTKRSTAENEAQGQIDCYERFGNDLLFVEYGLHGLGIALGSEMTDPEDSVPSIKKYAMDSLTDVHILDREKLKLKNDKKFRLHCKATEILVEKMGAEVPIGVLVTGPFTAAASLYKIENLLRATRKEKEALHNLIRFCTDELKLIYREFIKRGAMILLCDPIASGTILHRKQYQEFVLPYSKEIMDDIHEAGGMVCYHICGDTTLIIEDMVSTGCDILSIDNIVNINHAKKIVGNKMPILGNVDPVEVMYLGNPSDVDKAVRECIKKGREAEGGYILATGCDLSGNIPLENLDQFMASARKYSKMEMDEL